MANDGYRLTPRERAVLALVAQGLTNQAIARRLGIRLPTVKQYLDAIYRKFNVQDRVSAVLCGLALDLIPPPSPEPPPPPDPTAQPPAEP